MPLPRTAEPLSLARLALGALVQPAFFVILLFGPAPTWAWWRAWVLIAMSLLATVVSLVVLARDNPVLLAERFKPPIQRDQPCADKLAVLVFVAAFVGALLFIPFDVFEWRLVAPPGAPVAAIGLAAFLTGWWILQSALRVNAFAVPVVKRQAERRQHAVDSGPYAVVRHPMYAGIALVLLGAPLWLGSSAGAVVALVPIAALGVRIGIEERFLRRELPGYAAYAARVRHRLIPGLW
jgi:protein-S-isoprenylcysteine O-methyltransferase Ste14